MADERSDEMLMAALTADDRVAPLEVTRQPLEVEHRGDATGDVELQLFDVVEMHVGVDQAGHQEAAADVHRLGS